MEEEEKERREDGTLSKEPRTKSQWQQDRKTQSLKDQVTKTRGLKPSLLRVSVITKLNLPSKLWKKNN